jgi:hypothetical protein
MLRETGYLTKEHPLHPIHVGQRVELDLVGLQVMGGGLPHGAGTVVALDPGVITVRLDHARGASEVMVSHRRVIGRLAWR